MGMKENLGFQELFQKAVQAGLEAGEKSVPQPMIVEGGGKRYFVSDGVCGFAWVQIKPGNSAFAKWGKKMGYFSKAYGGGVMYWVGFYNQSMQKKEAFAGAMADVLSAAGINAYSMSRMD